MNNKEHWEKIFSTKEPNEVGWTQNAPTTSLDFINSLPLSKKSKIIDIGGGQSKLADYLLEEGFENITVLDISANAVQKVQNRLGEKAAKIKWIVSDITEFEPSETYDLWHDRATFHFLIRGDQKQKYISLLKKAAAAYIVLATFSEDGPGKCSGLPVQQYSEESLTHFLEKYFRKIRCIKEDHETPFHTKQNFLFCSFSRKSV